MQKLFMKTILILVSEIKNTAIEHILNSWL